MFDFHDDSPFVYKKRHGFNPYRSFMFDLLHHRNILMMTITPASIIRIATPMITSNIVPARLIEDSMSLVTLSSVLYIVSFTPIPAPSTIPCNTTIPITRNADARISPRMAATARLISSCPLVSAKKPFALLIINSYINMKKDTGLPCTFFMCSQRVFRITGTFS